MQVFSHNQTIVAEAGARVIKTGPELPDTAIIYNPPHTLLELDDEEAQRMISAGRAERYVRAVHGESPPFKRQEPQGKEPAVVA